MSARWQAASIREVPITLIGAEDDPRVLQARANRMSIRANTLAITAILVGLGLQISNWFRLRRP